MSSPACVIDSLADHGGALLEDPCRVFITVFSRRETSFYRLANLFELRFFVRRTIL